MNIVICIKPIKASLLNKSSIREYVINYFDLYALQEINRYKLEGHITVTGVIMGRVDCRMMAEIKYLGVDEIILICDPCYAGSDTYATTYVLCNAISKINNVDWIVCGDHSMDGETGHVGPSIARRLDLPYISGVMSIKVEDETLNVSIHTNGKEQLYRLNEKSVLSFGEFSLKDIVLPLKAVRRINTVEYKLLTNEDLRLDISQCGLEGSKTKVVRTRKIEHSPDKENYIVNVNDLDNYSNAVSILKGEYNHEPVFT